MKVDLKSLCNLLAKASEEANVSTESGNIYLLNQVLQPLMQGETVLLKDIDFSRFDGEDIRWLARYYEALEMQGRKLIQIVGAIANIEPAACKARRFC